jgi:hypothetical protein
MQSFTGSFTETFTESVMTQTCSLVLWFNVLQWWPAHLAAILRVWASWMKGPSCVEIRQIL